jgi:serine/threonine-protein kinase
VSDPSIAAERVGRYQLLEPIGAGPNGAVARGKVFGVAGLERQFAIKRFHPELTVLAPMAQAISAAARAYGTLEHPRIAKLAELGVAGGETFTAVEFVSGLDALRLAIEARAAGTTLPVGGALGLVSSAARAVGYAHGRGLCHLGLSPSNVIVTVEGDVKVTDFGILAATIGSSPTEQPRLDRRIGYLAPEQLAGEATSTATDVYALGVIAYELVTGQPAFAGGSSAEIAAAVLAGPPRDPMLPRPIVRVLQRCLARSPMRSTPRCASRRCRARVATSARTSRRRSTASRRSTRATCPACCHCRSGPARWATRTCRPPTSCAPTCRCRDRRRSSGRATSARARR